MRLGRRPSLARLACPIRAHAHFRARLLRLAYECCALVINLKWTRAFTGASFSARKTQAEKKATTQPAEKRTRRADFKIDEFALFIFDNSQKPAETLLHREGFYYILYFQVTRSSELSSGRRAPNHTLSKSERKAALTTDMRTRSSA